jgi:hypothetical protein
MSDKRPSFNLMRTDLSSLLFTHRNVELQFGVVLFSFRPSHLTRASEHFSSDKEWRCCGYKFVAGYGVGRGMRPIQLA